MKEPITACAIAPANPLRVVIADDMELLRIGLRHALESEPDLKVVGVAADGREAIALCGHLQPDLALLDERMPVMNGLQATRAIKQRFPSIRVIILAPHGGVSGRKEAVQAGADGWLLKHAPRSELIATVWQVQRGELQERGQEEAYLQDPCAGIETDQARLLVEPLTPRELDVLRLLIRGKTNAAIAHDLGLSRGTIKAYVEQIIAKLHVSSRTQAAVRAVELGLLYVTAE